MFSSLKVWGLSVRIMGSGSRLPERCDILQLHKWEFPKLGVPYFGVLIIRILFRVLY